MSGGIFIVNKDKLIELTESKYDSETILQELLTKYPNLLAGKQINSDNPRKWLLIKREFSIPDKEDGAGRWSVDHLFLDQDGIPTLIEVKRSTDTRIRREVVGQMLDYAANAISYWPVTLVQEEFIKTCEKNGKNADGVVAEFLGDELSGDEFWQKVSDNLKTGKVRLLFVADIIPRELQRVIEFLNEKMDTVEVLGVEVKQYKGSGTQSFVPRVIGQTAQAQIKKQNSSVRKKWDENSFFEDATNGLNSKQVSAIKKLYDFSKEYAENLGWGTGGITGSFSPKFSQLKSIKSLYSVRSIGRLSLNFGWLDDNETVKSYRDKFKESLERKKLFSIPKNYQDHYHEYKIELWMNKVDDFIKVTKDLIK